MAVFFLQEIHSSIEDEKQWSDNFKRKIFYSHGITTPVVSQFLFLVQNL